MDPYERELHELLHQLWTRDVGTPGYDKAKWKRLEADINELVRMSFEERRQRLGG